MTDINSLPLFKCPFYLLGYIYYYVLGEKNEKPRFYAKSNLFNHVF